MTNIVKIESTKQLGESLRMRRKSLGITQIELAKFCNLSHTGIGHIERGQKDVRMDTLLKLAKFLGLKFQLELED